MEWFYHCQGTESAAEMPFIIVHLGLAVASLRLYETGTHENCVWLWLLEAEKLSTVSKLQFWSSPTDSLINSGVMEKFGWIIVYQFMLSVLSGAFLCDPTSRFVHFLCATVGTDSSSKKPLLKEWCYSRKAQWHSFTTMYILPFPVFVCKRKRG